MTSMPCSSPRPTMARAGALMAVARQGCVRGKAARLERRGRHCHPREVARYGRIFQYGTQQRSMAHVRFGCELVRNGRLGSSWRGSDRPSYGFEGGSIEPAPVPEDLDYDFGSAGAWRPYTKDRCTCWALTGLDNAHGFIGAGAPIRSRTCSGRWRRRWRRAVEYEGTGKFGTGLFDAPFHWTSWKFSSGVSFHFIREEIRHHHGREGEVWISRRRTPDRAKSLASEKIVRMNPPLREPGPHDQLSRVRSDPEDHRGPAEVAVLSDTMTQLSMIAIWTGRKIRWTGAGSHHRRSRRLAAPHTSLAAPWHL